MSDVAKLCTSMRATCFEAGKCYAMHNLIRIRGHISLAVRGQRSSQVLVLSRAALTLALAVAVHVYVYYVCVQLSEV